MNRIATSERRTKETVVRVTIDLDGSGRSEIQTGLGFLDHMLDALALHSRCDIALSVTGDLHVDDHHTVEDAALTLGRAIDEALADRGAIRRFGSAYAPLDEALARCVIDCSGRGGASVALGLRREMIGQVASENIAHFMTSFATAARLTLHLDVLRGANDHHRCEAAFKALALALREACCRDDRPVLPSTKGVL